MNVVCIIESSDPRGLGGVIDPRAWVILDEFRSGIGQWCAVLVLDFFSRLLTSNRKGGLAKEGLVYYILIQLNVYVGFAILMVSLPDYYVVIDNIKGLGAAFLLVIISVRSHYAMGKVMKVTRRAKGLQSTDVTPKKDVAIEKLRMRYNQFLGFMMFVAMVFVLVAGWNFLSWTARMVTGSCEVSLH